MDCSPAGTAASARMALIHAKSEMQVGETFTARSIIGSEFHGRIAATTRVGTTPAITPEITGRAWITGTHQHMLDPTDPWPRGYRLSDTCPTEAQPLTHPDAPALGRRTAPPAHRPTPELLGYIRMLFWSVLQTKQPKGVCKQVKIGVRRPGAKTVYCIIKDDTFIVTKTRTGLCDIFDLKSCLSSLDKHSRRPQETVAVDEDGSARRVPDRRGVGAVLRLHRAFWRDFRAHSEGVVGGPARRRDLDHPRVVEGRL